MEFVKDISFMFYGCASLISLPDISKWKTDRVCNLNSIFGNCSLLNYIPNISKWKLNFNNKIKINNIFKGCKSLLIIPDLSKWNIDFSKYFNISSSSDFCCEIIKTDSLLSENIIKNYSLSELSSSSKSNNDIIPFDNNIFIDNSKDENLDDYYDNFYS